jgi:hypothetical protein
MTRSRRLYFCPALTVMTNSNEKRKITST